MSDVMNGMWKRAHQSEQLLRCETLPEVASSPWNSRRKRKRFIWYLSILYKLHFFFFISHQILLEIYSPPQHSWSNLPWGHKHHPKRPQEHCKDQRWSWRESLETYIHIPWEYEEKPDLKTEMNEAKYIIYKSDVTVKT